MHDLRRKQSPFSVREVAAGTAHDDPAGALPDKSSGTEIRPCRCASSMQIVIIGLLIMAVQRIFRLRLVV